jgi:hypothetical protein
MKRAWVLAFVMACETQGAPPRPSVDRTAPSVEAAEPSGPRPAVLVELEALAVEFRRVEVSTCVDRCCFPELPEWTQAFRDADDVSREQLRAAIAATKDVEVLALAVRRLGKISDPEDIEMIAPFASSTADAGPFPQVEYGQAVVRCPKFTWEHATFGRVALDALQSITGGQFKDVTAFAKWRAEHPRLLDEFDYWLVHPKRIYALRARDPELFVRVATMAQMMPDDLRVDDVVADAKQKVGPERLLHLLEGRDKWPEQSDKVRYDRFCLFVLEHAPELFGADHVAALLRLWEARVLSDEIHSSLAVAIAKLEPKERRRVLVATIGQVTYGAHEAIRELATYHFDDELPLLRKILSDPEIETSQTQNRRVLFEVLTSLGRAGLPKAKALLAGAPRAALEQENVTEALAAWANSLEPSLRLPGPREIHGWALKNTPEADRQKVSARAAQTRKAVVDRILKWMQSAK